MSTPFSRAYSRFRKQDLSKCIMTAEEKLQLGKDINSKKFKISELQKRFNLSERRLQRYAKAEREGRVLHGTGGHPVKLDAEAKEEVKAFLVAGREANQTPNAAELRQKVAESVVQTNTRRGDSDAKKSYSKTYFLLLKKELSITEGEGQEKTAARIAAEADPRNAYSEALLFNAFQTGLSPALILNADATQYCVAVDNEGATNLVWVRDAKNTSPPTAEAPAGGGLNIFVKSMVLIGCAGHFSTVVTYFFYFLLNCDYFSQF
jgi:hypothetical protein